MKLSAEGKKLIQHFEQLRLEAYPDGKDKDGNIVYSIGWGHRDKALKAGEKINRQKAQKLFDEDVESVEGTVNTLVTAPLSQQEFDALCSFVYNIGHGQFKESRVLIRLNQKDRIPAADHMTRWNRFEGEINRGLVKRRAIEKAYFLGLDYETSIQKGDEAYAGFEQGL